MKLLQAFRYELRPTREQAHQMCCFAGSCRFVFNRALVLQEQRYKAGDNRLGYAGLCKLLTQWRNSSDTAWLAQAPAHPLQQALKDLERAYGNFFAGRAALPRFKRKAKSVSFRYPDPKQIRLDQANSRIFLPKLGWLRYRNSREVLGEVKQVTVSTSGSKWFVSVQTEREVEAPRHPSGSMVGVDLGVNTFAACSDGTSYQPLNSYRKRQKRLAFLQRRMSRKQKFSKNWKKAKAQVQRLHTKVANARRDYLHKTSTDLCKKHAIVVIEDLQVGNLSASARGTVKQPGTNVRAKSGLNKAILDQGWAECRRHLDYKLGCRGGRLVIVPPGYTSQRCSRCKHTCPQNRITQERFACVSCGLKMNAHINAALNILAAGQAVLACGESALSGRSTKQESTVDAV